MMERYLFIVIGMALVTYIPRMLPMVLLKDIKLPGFIKRFFQFIPYAALGALIFPGVLYSTGDVKSAALGGVVSVILALFRVNVIIVVFGGIFGVLAWGMFIH
jgi:branched-subunit amino acid transport protein